MHKFNCCAAVVLLCIFSASQSLDARAADTAVVKLNVRTRGQNHHIETQPRFYRGVYEKSSGPSDRSLRSPERFEDYEKRVAWMHQAKYGVACHFLANQHTVSRIQWDSEKWNKHVDTIDVEKFADQVKELGAGYAILTIGQNCQYACAPNPVIDKYWELQPGQYNSRRDLPWDLGQALKKRGIRLMLYVATDHQHKLPRPASLSGDQRFQRWVEALQWYSDHYGTLCSGWWVDGLTDWTPGYTKAVHDALRHGNPQALIGSGNYVYSDFLHGHCQMKWAPQQHVLPRFGRFDPEYGIQWQAFQYLGKNWGQPGVAHSHASFVNYAKRIVEGGGVITFDLGTRNAQGELPLEIADDQMAQLRLVRDALKEVPANDGAAVRRATLQKILLSEEEGKLRLHNVWPLHWTGVFELQASGDTTLVGRVEDGVLIELQVTPAARLKDLTIQGMASDGNLARDCAARILTVDGKSLLRHGAKNLAWHGVDGDPATGAQASKQFAWTYEIDLGAPNTIGRVAIAFKPDSYASSYRVMVSEDGENWSQVYQNADADGAALDTKIDPVTARLVRVIADKPNGPNQKGTQMHIVELKVYP